MNKSLNGVLIQWLPLVVVITAMCGLVYLTMQQDLRIGANDPQIQIAEDTATALNNGTPISFTQKINVDQSLAPFTIIYDNQGNVVQSSATLDGQTPQIPQGALNDHKGTSLSENRLTWQPKPNVRLATVIVPFNKGHVLVGRNMREIEIRVDKLFFQVLLAWIATLLASFFATVVIRVVLKK